MNNRQSGRRRRGGGGNAPRPMGQAIANQGAGNRLEVRVRGNAHQLLEKYKQLARDAHQSGDRVAAEYYLQHADHYFRILNDVRIRQEEMRARRAIFDPLDDEPDEDEVSDGGEVEEMARDTRLADREARDARGPREGRDLRAERDYREPRENRAGRDDRDGRRRFEDRRPRERREERGEQPPAEGPPLSDGEAALVAFGRQDVPPPAPEVSPATPPPPATQEAADVPEEAPRRRRTRTRRTEPAPAEG